jgi:hypothetical protein
MPRLNAAPSRKAHQERDQMPNHEPRRKPVHSRIVLNDRFARSAVDGQILRCPRCDHRYLHSELHHETSAEKLR